MSVIEGYDVVLGDLAVKFNAVSLSAETRRRLRHIRYSQDAPHKLEPFLSPIGPVNLYFMAGTFPLHTDDIDANERTVTIGLILENDAGFHLTDGIHRIPLPVGSIYRLKSLSAHGTCLADGSATKSGKLAFICCDYYDDDEEGIDTPEQFAGWIISSVHQRLAP